MSNSGKATQNSVRKCMNFQRSSSDLFLEKVVCLTDSVRFDGKVTGISKASSTLPKIYYTILL